MKKLVSLLIVLASSFSYAVDISITVTDYGPFAEGATFQSAEAREAVNEFFTTFSSTMSSQIPDTDQSTFLSKVALSSTMASKGGSEDYGYPPDVFVFGAFFGAGFSIDFNTSGSTSALSSIPGASVSNGFLVGAPLAQFGGSQYFKNGLAYLTFNTSSPISIGQFEATFSSFSVKYAYMLKPKDGSGFIKWNGVKLSTGLDYNHARVLFKYDISVPATETGDISAEGATFTGTTSYEQEISLGAAVSTTSIPFEVSTGVDLRIIGLIAGFGVDLNLGSAKSVASGEGPVTLTMTNSGTSEESTISATSSFDFGQSASPTFFHPRLFLGADFDFYVGNFFLQYNQGLGSNIIGFLGGFKTTW